MTILPQETLLELYGKRILILHGDTLCIDDAAYQNYRKKFIPLGFNGCFCYSLFLCVAVSRKMRQNSQYASSMKAESIMDVNSQAVIDALQRHQAQWMIHGHTHRPAIHEVNIEASCIIGVY
ncbi:hypothetical protein J4731_20415 [Providencia rettgeri]|nr:hypothetical protein [Providencia rettgeri]